MPPKRSPQKPATTLLSDAAFAPGDVTDGRGLCEWESRYPQPARKEILYESIYVGLTFIFYFGLVVFFLYLSTHGSYAEESADNSLAKAAPNGTAIAQTGRVLTTSFLGFCCAWAAGGVGGSLFGLKWMYHCVAKQIWHQDRRLWRILTPHLSAVLAFFMMLIISSGFIKVFAENIVIHHIDVMAFSFLVGYFSDKALAKLAEVADTVFGSNRKTENK